MKTEPPGRRPGGYTQLPDPPKNQLAFWFEILMARNNLSRRQLARMIDEFDERKLAHETIQLGEKAIASIAKLFNVTDLRVSIAAVTPITRAQIVLWQLAGDATDLLPTIKAIAGASTVESLTALDFIQLVLLSKQTGIELSGTLINDVQATFDGLQIPEVDSTTTIPSLKKAEDKSE